MPAHELIGNRKQSLIEASATFDYGLSTQTMHPHVATGGQVPTSPGLAAFKAMGVIVIATAKQCDLGCGRTRVVYNVCPVGHLSYNQIRLDLLWSISRFTLIQLHAMSGAGSR